MRNKTASRNLDGKLYTGYFHTNQNGSSAASGAQVLAGVRLEEPKQRHFRASFATARRRKQPGRKRLVQDMAGRVAAPESLNTPRNIASLSTYRVLNPARNSATCTPNDGLGGGFARMSRIPAIFRHGEGAPAQAGALQHPIHIYGFQIRSVPFIARWPSVAHFRRT